MAVETQFIASLQLKVKFTEDTDNSFFIFNSSLIKVQRSEFLAKTCITPLLVATRNTFIRYS